MSFNNSCSPETLRNKRIAISLRSLETGKRKFIPAEEDLPVEDSYVTIKMDGADGLIVKKAKKPGHDLTIPLVSEQLKILFGFLTQEGTSCLGASSGTYNKSGKYAKSSSVNPEDWYMFCACILMYKLFKHN